MVKANGPVAAALRLSGAKNMRVVSLIEYKDFYYRIVFWLNGYARRLD